MNSGHIESREKPKYNSSMKSSGNPAPVRNPIPNSHQEFNNFSANRNIEKVNEGNNQVDRVFLNIIKNEPQFFVDSCSQIRISESFPKYFQDLSYDKVENK